MYGREIINWECQGKSKTNSDLSVLQSYTVMFSFALEIYSFSFSSCKIGIKLMVVLMYSLTPVSNNIE